MNTPPDADAMLVSRIRQADPRGWEDLIARYEGRLLAFAESRVGNRAASEDIVQETFVGFLTSLPNFDGRRPLESYLFSICAYKLTDHLRREGRRPAIRLDASTRSGSRWQLPGAARPASSIARSVERKRLEEQAVREAIAQQITRWHQRSDWSKLKCLELLFVRGIGNKQVADELGLTEQQVANYKSDFQSRLKAIIRKQGLSDEVFPELVESDSDAASGR